VPASPIKNRALVTLMAGHFSNDLLVGVLPILYPSFKAEFGMSNSQLGLVTLGYAIASSLTQPIFGYISDRVQRRWFPPVIVLWGGIFVGMYGFATGFWSLFVMATLAGLASAAFHPLGATNAASVVRDEHRNTSMSLYTVAGTAGFALGPLVGVLLVRLFGLHGTIGFTLFASLSAALMATRMRQVEETQHAHRHARTFHEQVALPPADYRMLARIIVAIMLRSWTYMAILQFTPLWYDEMGYSSLFFGVLITVVTLFSALGTLGGGWFADRIGGRKVVVGSLALTMPMMLMYVHLPGAGAFAFGPGYGMLSDASSAIALLAAQRLMPGRAGVASSTILGLGFVSGGLGVPIVGALIDSVGYTSGLSALIFVNLAATLIAATIPATVWGAGRSRSRVEQSATAT
jgi:MFS transporter, FSR family, fosmidomycin resistance protein